MMMIGNSNYNYVEVAFIFSTFMAESRASISLTNLINLKKQLQGAFI